MMILYFLFALLGCLVVLRALILLFTAEAGRRHDLIKHIYRSGTDFQIAVVIPYLDSRKIRPFQELLTALGKQDYPSSRVGIHVVTTEDASFGLPPHEDLPSNVKVWVHPSKHVRKGEITSWLIERLLAAGGPSKLFAFLDADDIVRPDFLRNVTTRAFDCFAMQGYIALKRPPKGMLSYVAALSTRLVNRIENAGKFHLGLSCRLMNSGWVIRQELLEMIPFRQGEDMDNLEYTALLNLHGYRINWAPNIVVYKEESLSFSSVMKDVTHSLINRLRLGLVYSLQLMVRGIVRLDINLIEQAWGNIKPPNFIIGLIALLCTAVFLYYPPFLDSFYYAVLFTLAFWSSQLISAAVARCSFKDVLMFIFATPLVYFAGILLFPLFLIATTGESLLQISSRSKKIRMGNRFDESKPAKSSKSSEKIIEFIKKNPHLLEFPEDKEISPYLTSPLPSSQTITGISNDSPSDFAEVYRERISASESSEDLSFPPHPALSSIGEEGSLKGTVSPFYSGGALSEDLAFSPHPAFSPNGGEGSVYERVSLPISNGRNSVDCTITSYLEKANGDIEEYYLTFEYKNLSFTTKRYKILDQAYYELQAKLQTKGFSIVSCGSCAYFYRPSSEGKNIAKDHGFCLFGKSGKEIDFDSDRVIVIDKACEEHTSQEQRHTIVKQWQESLQQAAALN